MLPRAIAVAALHKKYFSAFCASCYCARRVLISSQRRHQTLQTDAAREEMHLCAMHKRALFAAAAAAAATEFFLSTISLEMDWNYFAAAPQIKGKRLRFCLWPVSWLGRRCNRFCVSPAANYCAKDSHKLHFIYISYAAEVFCLEILVQLLGCAVYFSFFFFWFFCCSIS